jgi:hypothetical protein
MKVYLCDFCRTQTPDDDSPYQQGWFMLGQFAMKGDSANLFVLSNHGVVTLGYFCSISCLARFAEMAALDVSEAGKKG